MTLNLGLASARRLSPSPLVGVLMGMLMIVLCVCIQSANAESTLSERQYRVVESLQNDLAKDDFAKVIKDSESAAQDWSEGLGLVLVLQLRGQAFQLQDKDAAAIKSLARAYALNQLSGTRQTQLAMQLGQLYLAADQWADTRTLLSKALEQPLPEGENHPAMAYTMLALAWQLDDKQPSRWNKSIPPLKKAMSLSDKPPESWLTLLVSAQYQTQDYASAENTLKLLIARSAENKNYWLQLASMQQLQSKPKDQLSTLELADQRGILTNEDEVLLLAQLQIMEGIPERAARRLQQGVESEQVSYNIENQRRIAIALQQGRDYLGASQVLLEAAKTSGDAGYATTALQLLLVEGNCEEALKVSDWLIVNTGSNEQGPAMMSAGQCAIELKQNDRARVYFQRALKLPNTTNTARQWLDYLTALTDID